MMHQIFLIFLLLVGTGYAATPADAALLFANAVRDDQPKTDITPLCYLNPDTGELKKNRIFFDWQEQGKIMMDAPFVLVEEKILNDHAAVVLSQRMSDSLDSLYVCSLALVRAGEAWKPAPVFSSFENSVVSFAPSVIETRKSLVRWMIAREQRAREEIAIEGKREFQLAMRRSITPEQLATSAPADLVRGFIQAARDRDPAAAIARLGGYLEDPSAEITRLHQHVSRCFASAETMNQWPWNMITDPRTMLVFGGAEKVDGVPTVNLLALHHESLREEPQILSFQIVQDEGNLSRLQLPLLFTTAELSEDDDGMPLDSQNEPLMKLLQSFVKDKRQSQPKDLYTSSETFAKYIAQCLADNDFTNFWVAVVPDRIYEKNGRMLGVIDLWQSLQQASGMALFALIASKQEAQHTLVMLQSYSPADGLRLKSLWLERKKEKWQLLMNEPADAPAVLTDWVQKNSENWTKSISLSLTEKAQRISALANVALDVERIRSTFEPWQKAMDAKNFSAVLPFCASFDDESSIKRMLRNLSSDVVYDAGKKTILQVHQSGRWGGVSGRIDFDKGGKPHFPLHVFVSTDAGPRLLPQLDLRLTPGADARNFLNKNTLRDLAKLVPAQAVAELQVIIDAHSKLIATQSLIPVTPRSAAKP